MRNGQRIELEKHYNNYPKIILTKIQLLILAVLIIIFEFTACCPDWSPCGCSTPTNTPTRTPTSTYTATPARTAARTATPTPALDGYVVLKAACANNPAIFFQDFDGNDPVTASDGNQWYIKDNLWWFPNSAPVLSGSNLVLESVKNATNTYKQEAQTMTEFTFPTTGELIIGFKSSRWSKGYEFNSDYWVDSSVGLELYAENHSAIVFVFGNLGVFQDPTGYCPANSCSYAQVVNWDTEAAKDLFQGIKITWFTQIDNTLTFRLFLNNEASPRAELTDIQYIFTTFRIRLNANVTDSNKLPAIDSDILYIDYVCLKDLG